jgi:hypothetical protein
MSCLFSSALEKTIIFEEEVEKDLIFNILGPN